MFPEVRAIGHILARENVALEVVKTVERELRHPTESKSRYRRREGMVGRELIEVVETTRFAKPVSTPTPTAGRSSRIRRGRGTPTFPAG